MKPHAHFNAWGRVGFAIGASDVKLRLLVPVSVEIGLRADTKFTGSITWDSKVVMKLNLTLTLKRHIYQ